MPQLTPTPARRRAAVVSVKLVRERGVTYGAAEVTGPEALAAAVRAVIGDLDREAMAVVHMNQRHRIHAIEVVALGAQNMVVVTAREVFRGVLLAGAAAVALAHVHPSGDPVPSAEDWTLTRNLLAAGELLGVRVLDHVVLGDPGHVSMRESGSLWADFPFHR